MAQDPTRIDDVKRPGKSVPSSTSRPLVVTNRSVLTSDPMMVSDTTEDTKLVPPMVRPARVIKPLESTVAASKPDGGSVEQAKNDVAPPLDAADIPPELVAGIDLPAEPAPPQPLQEAASAEATPKPAPKVPEPESLLKPAVDASDMAPKPVRDPEAEMSAEEIAAAEAQAKRDLELDQLITSGKYYVPINAVQRRRLRMHVVLLCAVGILLVVALADVVVDAGFVSVPVNIPHTHFFSTTASGS